MKCLYHANCNDGAAAALAVWMKFKDHGHEYIPVQYGEEPPSGLENEDVVIVDFSYKRNVLLELDKICKSILILDHHVTAKDDLKDIEKVSDIKCIFDMTKSGSMLTWEYFHDEKSPELFDYIQDRDLWIKKIVGSDEIHDALQLYQNWKKWPTLEISDLMQEGFVIKKFLNMKSQEIIKTPPQKFNITGDIVPIYNITGFMISNTLHSALEKYPECDYAVAYFDLTNQNKRIYSLRSRKGSDVDVSVIAKTNGGGGHKHASGFSVELL